MQQLLISTKKQLVMTRCMGTHVVLTSRNNILSRSTTQMTHTHGDTFWGVRLREGSKEGSNQGVTQVNNAECTSIYHLRLRK